jgi:hypothetical protein
MRDMVDRMFDEGKKWAEIREAVVALEELWVQTHTKVQIIEYSFVSVGANKSAEVKRINSLEKLDNEIPEDMEIEDENNEQENTDNNKDTDTSGDSLKNGGETPEASEDIAPTDSENDEEEKNALSAEIEKLKAENEKLMAQNEQLKQDKENLSKELGELEAKQKHNNTRRVLIASTPKEELSSQTDEQIKAQVSKLL